VPVRLALSRIAARRAVEAYEDEAFLLKVKESFARSLRGPQRLALRSSGSLGPWARSQGLLMTSPKIYSPGF